MNRTQPDPTISLSPTTTNSHPRLFWEGDRASLIYDIAALRSVLLDLKCPVDVVGGGKPGLAARGNVTSIKGEGLPILASAPALPVEALGDPGFMECHGTKTALYSGAMANGIASVALVIAMGKNGFLGSYGSAGMSPARVEEAIRSIQTQLPEGPYTSNLIYAPNEPALEQRLVDLYIKYQVPAIEASAYLDMSPSIVHYFVSGLAQTPDGSIVTHHKVIGKLSRKEVARRFMSPAPEDILAQLVNDGRITPQQAELAHYVPVAGDITAEADSGGHTDNRPLVGLLPTLLGLRDELQEKYHYPIPVRIGAAGGISTPEATLAAFIMGAAYVVTGSVNQACIESGASEHTRKLLAQADMADIAMAPAADMFEMGVRVQVLKRGTLYPVRAQKLYEIYSRYESWTEVPLKERQKLETQVFKREFDAIWEDTARFFQERDPDQIERAEKDPHQKMALVFRWYLGLSSRWSVNGEKGREMDYQIWCGPSMGTFNDWVRGTYLEVYTNRQVADIACHLLTGAAYLARLRVLGLQGVRFSPELAAYKPERPYLAG